MEMKSGREFENLVANLYEKMGYRIEKNKLIKGKSKAFHEIDVYASKGLLRKKEVIVECKYRESDSQVEKDALATALMKSDDLSIENIHIVTNSCFNESTKQIAREYGVKLIEREELSKLCIKYGICFPSEISQQNLVADFFGFLMHLLLRRL